MTCFGIFKTMVTVYWAVVQNYISDFYIESFHRTTCIHEFSKYLSACYIPDSNQSIWKYVWKQKSLPLFSHIMVQPCVCWGIGGQTNHKHTKKLLSMFEDNKYYRKMKVKQDRVGRCRLQFITGVSRQTSIEKVAFDKILQEARRKHFQ